MNRRKICVVTGSRAEYGLLRRVMQKIEDNPQLELGVVVTGMHLVSEYGSTISEIEDDGFPIVARIETQLAGDSNVGMAKSLGVGVLGFADVFDQLGPHMLVALGDRFEILAATSAAALLGIPIAHISGGEVTEGAVDDWIRHAITKMSWIHFVAAEPYRRRVVQLGEAPSRVFNVGDPALDIINHLEIIDRPELEDNLGLRLRSPFFLVTYHPVTLGELGPNEAFAALLSALEKFPEATVVLTKPNADAGGRQVAAMAEEWVSARGGSAICVTSLGQLKYLSLMRYSDAVIGNSSSGIVEAPALKIPTVNIGSRQQGRLKATSVIDCEESCEEIQAAINHALSGSFRASLPDTVSQYGDNDASRRIVKILASCELPATLAKSFHDL